MNEPEKNESEMGNNPGWKAGGDPLEPAVETSITPEALTDLQAKAAKAEEHWDRFVRERADFDNFKKRAAREKQEAVRFSNEGLLQKLIPTLDAFDMALQAVMKPEGGSADSLRTGVEMIQSQLRNTLADAGLVELDATGQMFDPKIHEAVSQQESADLPEGQVLQQLRKGYKLHERLIRPASVIVSKKPSAQG